MSEPIDNHYFNWLYNKVCDIQARTPQLQFKKLLDQLYHTEFVWIILGDDNRAEDGCELRREFLIESRMESTDDWLDETCSVLEMLIAFSRHAGFQTDQEPKAWFWIMLDNLGLSQFNDAEWHNGSFGRVQHILEQFVWRTYEDDGRGGLFPLKYTDFDQRTIELWYQFSAYVYEQEFA